VYYKICMFNLIRSQSTVLLLAPSGGCIPYRSKTITNLDDTVCFEVLGVQTLFHCRSGRPQLHLDLLKKVWSQL